MIKIGTLVNVENKPYSKAFVTSVNPGIPEPYCLVSNTGVYFNAGEYDLEEILEPAPRSKILDIVDLKEAGFNADEILRFKEKGIL